MFIMSMLKHKRAIFTLLVWFAVMRVDAAITDNCFNLCSPEKIGTKCTTKIRALTEEEKTECDKMTVNCQSCTKAKKAQIDQSQNQCTDVCNTEQLIECHKKFETLSIKEKSECSKLIANCQSCTDAKKVQITKPQNQCTDVCNTEQLIECHKKFETLSIDEKSECTEMIDKCQSCTEERKTQANQKQNKCTDMCNTEQLIQCNKKFETLTLEQKALCNKMNSDCQKCTEENKI